MSKAKAVRITKRGYSVLIAIVLWIVGRRLTDISLNMYNLGNALSGQPEILFMGTIMWVASLCLVCYAITPVEAWLEVI